MNSLFALLLYCLPSHALTYDDFAQEIGAQNVTTLEGALALLPPTMRQNYVLMSDSLSVQPSTPQNPRAILFGDDARFVVAFNGDPQAPNYNELEMIQYREAYQAFEMRTISFQDGRVTYSNANPQRCLACHGSVQAQPIWGAFQEWQGSFAVDDHMSGAQLPGFLGFLKTQPTHPRYGVLIRTTAPYFPFTTDKATDSVQYNSHALQPGNRLANLFMRLNAPHQANEVTTMPYFQSHPARVLLGLMSLSHDEPISHGCLDAQRWATFGKILLGDMNVFYPPADFGSIYAQLAQITDPIAARSFVLQYTVLHNPHGWDINNFAVGGTIGSGRDYTLGYTNMADFLAAELMARLSAAQMPELKPYLRRVGTDELMASFGADYIAKEVAPYDHAYDGNGLGYDTSLAFKACDLLFQEAQ